MMELCTGRGTSSFPSVRPKHIQSLLHCKAKFPSTLKHTGFTSGLKLYINSSLRSSSEGTSTETTLYSIDKPEPDGEIILEDTLDDEKKEDNYTQLNEASEAESLVDNPPQLLKILEDFDIKFDYPETYSILVFGGGSLVALWLAAAVVGAIDSIPVFPKVLELIGLGYTIWFSTRYLIFKENRDELITRVKQIKQDVLGSKDD